MVGMNGLEICHRIFSLFFVVVYVGKICSCSFIMFYETNIVTEEATGHQIACCRYMLFNLIL